MEDFIIFQNYISYQVLQLNVAEIRVIKPVDGSTS